VRGAQGLSLGLAHWSAPVTAKVAGLVGFSATKKLMFAGGCGGSLLGLRQTELLIPEA